MTYIDPVKWQEAQQAIRQQMLAQPRGYQARLAEKLGRTPGFVHQLAKGLVPIPVEHLDTILESLGLEYDVTIRPKTSSPESQI
ncbi:hypothetical protein ACINK0_18085 (plasmid) [Deinococcus sp. VB343]|uniref:XRE family transcriptional regulator n=1 Tax=Deinococcus sp. VB142 TaxID=3112952 RepID=A0AAU6Q7M3_9DEIO